MLNPRSSILNPRHSVRMNVNPLEPPADQRLLQQFLGHFQIPRLDDPREQLQAVAAAFSRLPYENLSKIIRFAAMESAAAARELPREIVEGHIQRGTGGTCF